MGLTGLSELTALGLLVLLPLFKTQALPAVGGREVLAPPPPAARPQEDMVRIRPRRSPSDLLRAPARIPKAIERLDDRLPTPEPPSLDGVTGSIPPGVEGRLGDVLAGVGNVPPPPPRSPRPHVPVRIHVGGRVEGARALFQPKPEYPPLARMARIQGTVRLKAVIGRNGIIQNLAVLSGHPLLVQAALHAVAGWRYQPTLLNGEPVEVETEIDVTFTLAE